MNVTKHTLKRWTRRILGITGNEIDRYVTENEEQLKEHIKKTFDFSEFIYRGQLGDNITRNYYIQQDIIFVVNTQNNAIVTVYKVDFGFPNHINLSIAKDLLIEVHRLTKEKEESDFTVLEEIEKIDEKISDLDNQIEITKLHLKSLEEMKKANENMKKALKTEVNKVDVELQKTLNQLINSIEYKEDLKEKAI